MKHIKIAVRDRAELERRILLAFGINRADRMAPGELMMAVGVTSRPVDETPGLEAAIASLVRRGVLSVETKAAGRPAVLLLDHGAIPADQAAEIRQRLGLEDADEAPPFSRIMAVPDEGRPDWFAGIGSYGRSH